MKFKTKIRSYIAIVISLIGLIAFATQVLQFFTGKWLLDNLFELFMLVVFVVLALKTNKIFDLFNAVIVRIKENKELNRQQETGGTVPDDPDDEA